METRLNAILASLKTIRIWQFLVAAAVLLGASGATFGVYDQVSAPVRVDLQENQQIIPVQYGDLINQVSTSGNLTFPNREILRFGSQGKVASILLAEGDQVTVGQALARIDDGTAAGLSVAAAQAQIGLDSAQRSLDDTLNPDGLAIASARSAVAAGGLELKAAVESLADLDQEYQRDLAQARQAKADAALSVVQAQDVLFDFAGDFHQAVAGARLSAADSQLALDVAQDALSDFGPGYLDDLATALQAQADARLKLEAAQESLAGFNPDYLLELAEGRDAQADAQLALEAAQEALEDFLPNYDRRLAEALQADAEIRTDLRSAQQALDRYEDSNSSRLGTLRERKAELVSQVTQNQEDRDRLTRDQDNGVNGLDGHIRQLVETLVILNEDLTDTLESLAAVERLEADVQVAEADLAKAQTDVALLNAGPDPFLLAELQAAVELALSNLDQTNENRDKLEIGPDQLRRQNLEAALEVAQSVVNQRILELEKVQEGPDGLKQQQLQSSLAKAQADLPLADDGLLDLIADPDPGIVVLFEARVESSDLNLSDARQKLADLRASSADSAQLEEQIDLVAALDQTAVFNRDSLAAIQAGADPQELALREAGLALAEAALALAEQGLTPLEQGLDPLELSTRNERVVAARANLAVSESSLKDLLLGAGSKEVILAQARLDSAVLDLEEALQLERDSVVRSPLDGFVSAINVEEGDQVNANAPIVEVVDPSVVEIDGVVDEIDVLLLSVGIRAGITLDSLPGRQLEGEVFQISPAALNQQGVVTYPVRIRVEVPRGLILREGLTALANIVLQEELNVLLIPQQSLYGTFDDPLVRLVNGEGEIEERRVELGSSDDFWVEVRTGLKEGDRVAMVSAEVATTGAGFRGLRGVTGGGSRSRPSGGRR